MNTHSVDRLRATFLIARGFPSAAEEIVQERFPLHPQLPRSEPERALGLEFSLFKTGRCRSVADTLAVKSSNGVADKTTFNCSSGVVMRLHLEH